MPLKQESDAEIEDQAVFAMQTLARLAQHMVQVPGSGDLLRLALGCVNRDPITELVRRSRLWRRRFNFAMAFIFVALVLVAAAWDLGFVRVGK